MNYRTAVETLRAASQPGAPLDDPEYRAEALRAFDAFLAAGPADFEFAAVMRRINVLPEMLERLVTGQR